MSIQDLVQSGPNVSVTVGINDLIRFGDHLISTAKKEWEAAIMAKKEEKYLTPAEASKILHVNLSTLWRYGKNGYLVPIEVGGKRLYKQSDIDKILRK